MTLQEGALVIGSDDAGLIAQSREGWRFYLTPCCYSEVKGTMTSPTGARCRTCNDTVAGSLGLIPDGDKMTSFPNPLTVPDYREQVALSAEIIGEVRAEEVEHVTYQVAVRLVRGGRTDLQIQQMLLELVHGAPGYVAGQVGAPVRTDPPNTPHPYPLDKPNDSSAPLPVSLQRSARGRY